MGILFGVILGGGCGWSGGEDGVGFGVRGGWGWGDYYLIINIMLFITLRRAYAVITSRIYEIIPYASQNYEIRKS